MTGTPEYVGETKMIGQAGAAREGRRVADGHAGAEPRTGCSS